jgi:hypothetical protein
MKISIIRFWKKAEDKAAGKSEYGLFLKSGDNNIIIDQAGNIITKIWLSSEITGAFAIDLSGIFARIMTEDMLYPTRVRRLFLGHKSRHPRA